MARTRTRRDPRPQTVIGVSRYSSTEATHYLPEHTGVSTITDTTNPGPPFKSGGPMFLNRRRLIYSKSGYLNSQHDLDGIPQVGYKGQLYAPLYYPVVDPQEPSIDYWGAIGWRRTVPIKPVAQILNFMIELREFPALIKQLRALLKSLGPRSVRDLAGAHLGLQFGWIPLLSDLWSYLDVGDRLEKSIRQLARDNGKPVRRELNLFSDSKSELIENQSYTFCPLVPTLSTTLYDNSKLSSKLVTLKTDRKVWYSACYTYWIPELSNGYTDHGLLRLKSRLLGLTPTADVLYNAIPWSWLLDWFTNTGDVVYNYAINSEYHVVAKYAYVMGQSTFSYNTSITGFYRSGPSWGLFFPGSPRPSQVTLHASSSNIYEYKRRIAANPYGFGVTDADLNPFQWSILVALGLTRLT